LREAGEHKELSRKIPTREEVSHIERHEASGKHGLAYRSYRAFEKLGVKDRGKTS